MEKQKNIKRVRTLSAIKEAEKAQLTAANAGFNWDNNAEIIHKIIEEVDECIDALQSKANDKHHITLELGDLLFSCINLTRYMGIDAEVALDAATLKFKRRMNAMQSLLNETESSFNNTDKTERNALWAKAKITVSEA